ncbi:MAG: Do family serine endopeptidase [Hyphomicrobiaceae bacterium]
MPTDSLFTIAGRSLPHRHDRLAAIRRGVLGLGIAAGVSLAAMLAATGLPGHALAEEATTAIAPYPTAPATFADVVDKVRGSVVSIYVTGSRGDGVGEQPFAFPDLPDDHPLNEFFKKFRKDQQEVPSAVRPTLAQGSGFVVSEDGYIVTNNHVIDGAGRIEVAFNDGVKLPAELIGTDPRTDLAVIRITSGGTFPNVRFAETPVRVGDWVIAVGNPFGLGGSVTAGIVSASNRDIGSGPYDYLQIDAAVNRGNSGGPAFNLAGEVIGVNTAIFSPSGGNVGIAFAVPAALARAVVDQLRATGTVQRGWLGVHIQNVSDEIGQSLGMTKPKGALVTKIAEDGPAAGSALEVGDAIVAVNGREVPGSRDLARMIADLAPNSDASLTVLRDGREVEVVVKLGQFPSNAEVASTEPSVPAVPETRDLSELGLSLAPASALGKTDKGTTEEGVLITKVEPASEAADKGLNEGDIILEVAGEKVSAPGDVQSGVESARQRGRKAVLLRVRTGDQERFVALTLGKG